MIFGLSDEDIRRLRAGVPLSVTMEELVPEWIGDVWLSAQGTFRREVAQTQHDRTERTQVVFQLGADAFARLEAFPRKALTLSLKEPWPVTIYLVRGETEKDLLEEWAPLFGPDTIVRTDPRIL